MGRDDGLGFLLTNRIEDRIAVVGTIGEDGLGFDPVDQAECSWRITCLACTQIEAERVAECITGSMDLAGKAATRAAKSLVSLIFFAPAAQA